MRKVKAMILLLPVQTQGSFGTDTNQKMPRTAAVPYKMLKKASACSQF